MSDAMYDVRPDQVNMNRFKKPALGVLFIGVLTLGGCGEWAIHDMKSLAHPQPSAL